ncbi:Phosphate metabolism transcription protein [Extremus antarcticus]|uniref:Phosphate metabolism transcription protein n=1 Tax=Extremus antarcticus TaxID=702011 RepID=A0AAJ0DJ32_9PEZI|nr:Phosphate metabolism transcription protein [Extremus antarcticus]
MRFARTLQLATYAPWKDKYIDYAKLKKLLRDDDSAPSSPSTDTKDEWTDEDEGAFVDELVNSQLEKVHAFHKQTYDKLRDRTAACEAKLDDIAVADVQQGGQDGKQDGKQHGKQEDHQHDGHNDGQWVDEEASKGTPRNGGPDEKKLPMPNDLESQKATADTSENTTATGNDSGDKKGTSNGNGNGKQPVPSEDTKQKILNEVLSELDSITKETSQLEKYSRINYTGFLKAAKKHDRKRGGSYRVRPLLQVRLAALPFNKEDYGPLLYRSSAMYSFVGQHLTDGSKAAETRGKSMNETHPGKEEYVSHKFWVHPENLLEVKTMILRRLPVLVYNPQTSKIAEGNVPDPSITSIYFDNPSFDLYSNKVNDGEASSLRLRWYGQLEQQPQIWIEKKTVHPDEDGLSREARLTTKEKYVQRFVKGEYHMEKQIKKLEDRAGVDSEPAKSLRSGVEEIQTFIKENNVQPVLRANYTRTAFQIPGDNRVRISLDTELAFIREDALDVDRPCRDPESWHRTDIDNSQLEYPFSSIRKGEISRFPFALLEIKLRTDGRSRKSEWIQDIMNSHVVKPAPRFSKFVHGVANLFEDYVNTFPFWLSELETDIRRDPKQAFEEEQAKRRKEVEDDFAVGSLLRSPAMRDTAKKSPAQQATLSPIGSPVDANRGASQPGLSASHKPSNLGTSVTADSSTMQKDNVAEEPDDDETGTHAQNSQRPVNYGTLSGIKSLLPSVSSSKYAAHQRNKKLPPGVSKPDFWIKDQGDVKVEGKVWLANQRTFIKWQHVSVLLASLSVGLYNAAGEDNGVARALALVYTLVAIFAGVWGYGVYMWRVGLIERRSGKDFDAVVGPVVVCVGLIVALVLNFGFKEGRGGVWVWRGWFADVWV